MDEIFGALAAPFLALDASHPLDETELRRALHICGGRDLVRTFRGSSLPALPDLEGLRCWLRPRDEAARKALAEARPDGGLHVIAPPDALPRHGLRAWMIEGSAPFSERPGVPPAAARYVDAPSWRELLRAERTGDDSLPAVVAVEEDGADVTGTALALAAAGLARSARAFVWPGPLVEAAWRLRHLLNALELRPHGVQIVSCPTCGRCRVDLAHVAHAVDRALWDVERPLSVAVMGCAVNGPGEARHAHCGLAGGRGGAVLFRGGELLRRVEEEDMVEALVTEVRHLAQEKEAPPLAGRPWLPPATDRIRRARAIRVGDVPMGGGAPLVLQSMTNTDGADVPATREQIAGLHRAGAALVRLAVPDDRCVAALPALLETSPCPLVADIHFSPRLALASLEAGMHKLRINPGNLGGFEKARPVLDEARRRGVPVRVGVNGGSLDRELLRRHGGPTAAAMAECARRWVSELERVGVGDLVLSLKSSSVRDTLEAHRLLAPHTDCPLHVGITEAGFGEAGRIKSTVGSGLLLLEGLGDTLRVSLTGDPLDELPVARDILRCVRALSPRM